MAKVNGTTVLRDPATLRPVVLREGDDVPDWATGMVGDHLLDSAEADPEGYEASKVPVLEAEVASRNTDREDDDKVVPASGKKADLIAALVADDEHADNS